MSIRGSFPTGPARLASPLMRDKLPSAGAGLDLSQTIFYSFRNVSASR